MMQYHDVQKTIWRNKFEKYIDLAIHFINFHITFKFITYIQCDSMNH